MDIYPGQYRTVPYWGDSSDNDTLDAEEKLYNFLSNPEYSCRILGYPQVDAVVLGVDARETRSNLGSTLVTTLLS